MVVHSAPKMKLNIVSVSLEFVANFSNIIFPPHYLLYTFHVPKGTAGTMRIVILVRRHTTAEFLESIHQLS